MGNKIFIQNSGHKLWKLNNKTQTEAKRTENIIEQNNAILQRLSNYDYVENLNTKKKYINNIFIKLSIRTLTLF